MTHQVPLQSLENFIGMRRPTSAPQELDGPSWTVALDAVCGEATRDKIANYLIMRGLEAEISRGTRDFKFGDGVTVGSHFYARTFVSANHKTWRDLVILVLPGHTPPSCTTRLRSLECHGKMIYIDDVEMIKPANGTT